MLDTETAKSKQTEVKLHTSDRISALILNGDQEVASVIDELEAIYLEKYA